MGRKFKSQFVTTAEAARHFNISEQSLRRAAERGCPTFRCGRVFRWRLDLVEQWVYEQQQKQAEQQAA